MIFRRNREIGINLERWDMNMRLTIHYNDTSAISTEIAVNVKLFQCNYSSAYQRNRNRLNILKRQESRFKQTLMLKARKQGWRCSFPIGGTDIKLPVLTNSMRLIQETTLIRNCALIELLPHATCDRSRVDTPTNRIWSVFRGKQ